MDAFEKAFQEFSNQEKVNEPITPYKICKNCGKQLDKGSKKYCDIHCQSDLQYKEFIEQWKQGEKNGTIGRAWIKPSRHIKRFLFEKYENKCAQCGWSEVNPYTNNIPLEVEHIDGNAENNNEDNLTLLCPNCHSLTKSYRGANRGNSTRKRKRVVRNNI